MIGQILSQMLGGKPGGRIGYGNPGNEQMMGGGAPQEADYGSALGYKYKLDPGGGATVSYMPSGYMGRASAMPTEHNFIKNVRLSGAPETWKMAFYPNRPEMWDPNRSFVPSMGNPGSAGRRMRWGHRLGR
jgi:hypothetical protein